jgi:transposase
VEFSDDRLGIVLRRPSKTADWEEVEAELGAKTVAVYDLELTGVRLDSTTTYGYHTPIDDGMMQLGHSKDHRPDLAQVKLMAAAVEPSGHPLACDVVPGQSADDPLYLPVIDRVRRMLGRTGLLYAGDAKMAALATRAEIVAHGDYYLTPLPLIGQTRAEFDRWVDGAVAAGDREAADLLWDGKRLLGAGYEFEREVQAEVEGKPIRWTERVQVIRSRDLARQQATQLADRLREAEGAIRALTPDRGRGKRQMQDEVTLQEAIPPWKPSFGWAACWKCGGAGKRRASPATSGEDAAVPIGQPASMGGCATSLPTCGARRKRSRHPKIGWAGAFR